MITVVRGGLPLPRPQPGEVVVSDDEFRSWVVDGRVVRHVRRYQAGRLLTERLATSGRPMLAWALRLVTRGRCMIADAEGRERDLTVPLLVRWSWQIVAEATAKKGLLRRIDREITAIGTSRGRTLPGAAPVCPPAAIGPIVYLRTDLSFGVRAGGSVSHIAGVINELHRSGRKPILITTTPIPTLCGDIETHQVSVPERFW